MTGSKATILVVDDEANNRNVMVAQLASEGYALVTAESGEAALELIDRRLPDLILLDVMMPGISGFDVAEILKSEERTAGVPIIMLTALGDSDSRLTALTNGAEEFLTKPVARAELLARIHNLLKLKKHQDRLADEVANRTSELENANQQVTELRDQLLHSEKLAAIGQLAAGVAHEIGNPLNALNIHLQLLARELHDLPAGPRESLEELVQVAFSQRRKLLRHTLGRWLEARQFAGEFDTQRRAEEVPVSEFVALAQACS